MPLVTGPLILIAHNVLLEIKADAAALAGREERGGILLGMRRGKHFHVDQATLPMTGDRGSRFAFRRGRAGHQQIARARWRQSAHRVDWLGEWHSHPEAIPSPSGIDLASWRLITHRRGAPMLFLIIGYQSIWLGLMRPAKAEPLVFIERESSVAGVGFSAC